MAEEQFMPLSQSHPDKFFPFFPIFFVGMWIVVSFTISHLGWRSFSARYGTQTRPPGRAYVSPQSSFGSILSGYRNVVRVVFTETGIYFYATFLFRAFHPPFLVPWESVRRVEKREGFFNRGYYLDIEDAVGKIHVLLPKKVEDDLLRYYNGVLPMR